MDHKQESWLLCAAVACSVCLCTMLELNFSAQHSTRQAVATLYTARMDQS